MKYFTFLNKVAQISSKQISTKQALVKSNHRLLSLLVLNPSWRLQTINRVPCNIQPSLEQKQMETDWSEQKQLYNMLQTNQKAHWRDTWSVCKVNYPFLDHAALLPKTPPQNTVSVHTERDTLPACTTHIYTLVSSYCLQNILINAELNRIKS